MKVSVFNPYNVYPPNSGNKVTVNNQNRIISQHFSLDFSWWIQEGNTIQTNRVGGGGIKQIDLSNNLLSPLRKSKPIRVFSLLRGITISESMDYPAHILKRAVREPRAGIEIYHHSSAYNWLVRCKNSDATRRVVVVHDRLANLFTLRAQQAKNAITKNLLNINAKIAGAHEKRLAEFVDQIWCVNANDVFYFAKDQPENKVRHIFPPIDINFCRKVRQGVLTNTAIRSNSSKSIGVIGDYNHVPNLLSLKHIIYNLCPILFKKGFTGKISVVGKGVTSELVNEINKYKFIEYFGFIDSIENFWCEVDLLVLPHVGATGVRMKLVEALGMGVPVITNSAGLLGYPDDVRGCKGVIQMDGDDNWAEYINVVDHRAKRLDFSRDLVPESIDAEDKILTSLHELK
jgi:glycosyltransferase involved in cell wall biosynthesis